jgi:hypothetical protein
VSLLKFFVLDLVPFLDVGSLDLSSRLTDSAADLIGHVHESVSCRFKDVAGSFTDFDPDRFILLDGLVFLMSGHFALVFVRFLILIFS